MVIHPWLTRALWTTVLVLALVGVAASVWRGANIDDAGARLEAARPSILAAFGVVDRNPTRREDVIAFERRFQANAGWTLGHVIFGGVMLMLAPLQFVTRLRTRYLNVHRWSGRLLVACAAIAATSGMYFGLLMPFGGTAESAGIAIFGGLLLAALARAVIAIRRGDVIRHREWMIRMFALALAIAVIRVIGAPMDIAMTALGVRPQAMFAATIWTGWLLSMAGAEVWIRATRRRT
jgi:uncharacterized membrane protein